MTLLVVLVAPGRKRGQAGKAERFEVQTGLDLAAARKLVAKALRDGQAASRPAPKPEDPEKAARRAEKRRAEAEQAARRAARQAAREAKVQATERLAAERAAKRQAREAKRQAVEARKAQQAWLKGVPEAGDPVEYQEKPKGRWHLGRVAGVASGGHHFKVVGDRGTRYYPREQVRRTAKRARG